MSPDTIPPGTPNCPECGASRWTESTDGLSAGLMVCLECGYLPRASVREAINATEDAPAETYQVPAVDPETGDGWDVEVEAESLRDAMQKASNPPDAHVASSFVQKHLEIGGRKLPARVVNEQLRSSTSAHPGVLRIGHEDGNQTAQC